MKDMPAPTVMTRTGAVRGERREDSLVYLNIPYAAPPTGAGRFAPPQPHEPWPGVRDATVLGPNAPQAERRLGRIDMKPYFGAGWSQGEDYLTVNVWAPLQTTPDTPVMVFVHGGGFVAGSNRSSMYDGSTFARDGVILVTMNYRLGIVGFLDIPGTPANRGMLDVIAALEWVRRNIAAFGGDPTNVTLFGQSAGATIVGALLTSPQTNGLLRRAIIQSGSGLGAFAPEQASVVTQAAANALGIEVDAQQFAAIPDQRLVEVASRLQGLDLQTPRHRDPLIGLSPFSIVLDTQPALATGPEIAQGVDLLIGNNTDEGNLYLVPVDRYFSATSADVDRTAGRAHPNPADLTKVYGAGRPDSTQGQLLSAIMTDALFGAGTRALADAHAERPGAGATFRYEFTWPSDALDGALGAAHAVELPFVFDVAERADLRGQDRLLGTVPLPAQLARRMHATWIGFAATGDPGWQPYDTDRRPVMRIGAEWLQTDDPRPDEREIWT